MLTELAIIVALVLANSLFSLSEMAVVSARKSRLRAAADEGDSRAQAALALANSPTRFLSTVQVGITLISTLAAVFGGASISDRIALTLTRFSPIAPYAKPLSVALVVLAISYLSLIIGELVPKRIAMSDAERIAGAVARPLQAWSALMSPVVSLLSASTDALLHLLGHHQTEPTPFSADELRLLIDLSEGAGGLPSSERDILDRVFQLGDRRAWSVMKPRHEIVWLDIEDPPNQNWDKVLETGYSRYPVCRGELDTLLGIVSIKDLLHTARQGRELDLTHDLRQPLIVPESKFALEILDLFKTNRVHLAIVVDEFGGIQGIITLGDIMEALVGTISSADQPDESEAVQREDGTWLFDGTVPIDELKGYLDLKSLPGEQEGHYQTLAGFVMTQLGRIPSPGDRFEWAGLQFEVVDMDGRRIDKILVTPGQKDRPAVEDAVERGRDSYSS